jgi:hypothetical protein
MKRPAIAQHDYISDRPARKSLGQKWQKVTPIIDIINSTRMTPEGTVSTIEIDTPHLMALRPQRSCDRIKEQRCWSL